MGASAVFDIGGPEFLVICVVALVVLGPERLPAVMRTVGGAYRQVRGLLDEYTREAQRMFDEGMREVNDAAGTITAAWQEATAGEAPVPPALPAPALWQVPPAATPPATAAASGPWALPAWHRDTQPEPDPLDGATRAAGQATRHAAGPSPCALPAAPAGHLDPGDDFDWPEEPAPDAIDFFPAAMPPGDRAPAAPLAGVPA